MDPVTLGVAFALGSAALNATWNLRLKMAPDPLRVAAVAFPLATLLASPMVLVVWLSAGRPGLDPAGWVLAAVSGAVQVGYLHVLSRAYQRGDISSVYPTARGTAPVIAVLLGVAILGERLQPLHWIAVAVLVAGVWLVRPGAASRAALIPALAVGVLIAGYSALDRLGVQAGPWWLYGWLVLAVMTAGLLPSARRPTDRAAVPVAVLAGASYSLVLAALSVAPLAIVAPVRLVAGTVLVSGWGVLRLGEHDRLPQKLAGAVALATGVVLLAA
jgi:drug/metabolite transporter (DMT)-like permease